jgi:hypothetical protein
MYSNSSLEDASVEIEWVLQKKTSLILTTSGTMSNVGTYTPFWKKSKRIIKKPLSNLG